MSTTQLTTADQLLRISSELKMQGKRCELVSGELRIMSPGGWKHGSVIGSLHEIGAFIRTNRLGKVFGAETGFLLRRDPDTVRAPDFAFVSNASLPETDPEEAFWPGAPDFAVEVLSPGDSLREVDEKIQAWLAAGVTLLWVVDPALKTVTQYRSPTDVTIYTAGDVIDSIDLLPGFSLEVSQIFS